MDIRRLLDKNGVSHLWLKIKALPISTFTNDAKYVTEEQIPEGAAPSNTTPKMDGTASVGTEAVFARGDHVHPSDDSKVDVIEGKGLSTNDFTQTYKEAIDNLDATIQQSIAAAFHLTKEIVETLPTVTDAKENVIYLVPIEGATENNAYHEYMFINGKFEKTGSSDIDLSNYVKYSDIVFITNEEIDQICGQEGV